MKMRQRQQRKTCNRKNVSLTVDASNHEGQFHYVGYGEYPHSRLALIEKQFKCLFVTKTFPSLHMAVLFEYIQS